MKNSNVESDLKPIYHFLFHVGLFSLPYAMVIFSIPLYSYYRGASQFSLGIIGLLWMTPSIFIPLFLTKVSDPKKIQRIILLASFLMIPITFALPFFHKVSEIMVIVLILGCVEALWWISIEIYIGFISKGNQRVVAVYSFVWGVAFFIAPTLAGYITQFAGFFVNFSLASVIFLITFTVYILKRDSHLIPNERSAIIPKEQEAQKNAKVDYSIFIPSFVAGMIIGAVSAVYPGYLRSNGMSVFAVGQLFTAYAFARILGFLFLTVFAKKINVRTFFSIGLLFQLLIIIPFFSTSFVPSLIMMTLVGVGTGYGISSPLMYIVSQGIKPLSKSIVIYEISFGSSSAIASIASGYIGQIISPNFPYICLFVLNLIFLAYLMLTYRKHRHGSVNLDSKPA